MSTDTSTQPEILTPMALPSKAELATRYPEYYRAWNSMVANYSADVIALEWRGIIGLMRFIEDCSELPDAPPTTVPATVRTVLKRRNNTLPFSLANVYWKQIGSPKNPVTGARYSGTLGRVAATPVTDVESILAALKQLDAESITALHTSLLESEFAGVTLSAIDTIKRKLLDKVVYEGVELDSVELSSLIPIPPASKYEDI